MRTDVNDQRCAPPEGAGVKRAQQAPLPSREGLGEGKRRRSLAALILACALAGLSISVQAQAPAPPARTAPVDVERQRQAEREAEAALAAGKKAKPAAAQPASEEKVGDKIHSMFQLYWLKGGVLMIPITLLSVLVIILAIERLFGLRRGRVIPAQLVDSLNQLASKPGGLDPRAAYQLCQQFPSAAANVLRSVLLKVGRPHSEVEHTVAEASNREATKLYRNVRTINLAVSVAPLLGLLGTVQGMIRCFFDAANLGAGANKYQYLAEGIYTALITTFGGLVVAIPASVFAHYFEGRIQVLFQDIDELLSSLLPQLERYEGKLRVARTSDVQRAAAAPPPAPPVTPEPPVVAN
ncbi:MAG: MotA/TolQ/ExbB proton channel family protein [Planctomycetes bacterium]|nr:MotA/TolQ/ExbB proton channel family protein [Planctomycetota bacterium]